jgi:hypothetical protein
MTLTTGTPETRTEHAMPRAVMGFVASMGIPALIAIIGIAVLGWGAIHWLGAIIWGLVATFAFTVFSMMGTAMGMTRMDLLELLGSMMAAPHTSTSRAIGAVIHHVNGALLAVAWAYGAALVGAPANWISAGLGSHSVAAGAADDDDHRGGASGDRAWATGRSRAGGDAFRTHDTCGKPPGTPGLWRHAGSDLPNLAAGLRAMASSGQRAQGVTRRG